MFLLLFLFSFKSTLPLTKDDEREMVMDGRKRRKFLEGGSSFFICKKKKVAILLSKRKESGMRRKWKCIGETFYVTSRKCVGSL